MGGSEDSCVVCKEEQTKGHCDVEQHEKHRQEAHAKSTSAESLEKTWSNLQTDAVNEENQSELFDNVDDVALISYSFDGIVVEIIGTDVSDKDADKQYPSYAEGDSVFLASNFPLSETDAKANNEGIKNK